MSQIRKCPSCGKKNYSATRAACHACGEPMPFDVIEGELADENEPQHPRPSLTFPEGLREPQHNEIWLGAGGVRLRIIERVIERTEPAKIYFRCEVMNGTKATLVADYFAITFAEEAPGAETQVVDADIQGGPYRTPAARRADSGQYELIIHDIAWSVDHTQCTVEFEAVGAPNYSYTNGRNPWLKATVDMRADVSRQLGSGARRAGTALAARDPRAPDQQTVAVFGLPDSEPQGAPEMPDDAKIKEACRKVLQRHIEDALDERRRVEMRADARDALIGSRFKVNI
jgi:hypothetical protein